MRREGLVSTACVCARFFVYFVVKLSVNVQAHVFIHIWILLILQNAPGDEASV